MKVLFLVPHPVEAASYRYRIHQYLPFLNREQIMCDVRPFVSEKFYKIIYKRGFLLKKITYTLIGLLRRLADLLSIAKYDVIFIHLESSPFPLLFIEHISEKLGKPIIFDFDDAIFLKRKNARHAIRNILNSHKQPPKLISMSRHVIVGNPYLKEYSSRFTEQKQISVIPTCLDLTRFNLRKPHNTIPIIGWIGTHSTFRYLERILYIFPALAKNHDFTLKIIGASRRVELPGVNVVQKEWTLHDEIKDFFSLDIGLYPLYDPEWDKGKASFKALMYMASYVPCIASNIGRNQDVIEDGKNGFLVDSELQWAEKIKHLLISPPARETIAKEGRKTVEQHFSMDQYAPILTKIIQSSVSSVQ